MVEKPGKWEARCEGISVTFRPWGRTGWGAFGLVSLGGATLTLPAGLELQMNPSVWEISRSSAELPAPTEGLVLKASAGPAGRVFEVNATRLETDRLGRLLLEGAPAPGPGVLDGEARIEKRAEQGFEGSWRIAAIGAESTGKATVAGGQADARLDFGLEVERLDLARLFGALGLELPAGAEALGTLRGHVGASGPMAEPSSIVVKQRLEFTPPARLPAALTVLRGDFLHEVITSDGTRQTIDVSAASPTFIARTDVPSLLIETLLLAEDAAFFSHRGLDLSELPKALAASEAKETAVRGASTITQQLAKSLFGSRERTLRRKLQELALAFLLESTLGKDRILEIYLNVIEWGPGLYGLPPGGPPLLRRGADRPDPERDGVPSGPHPRPDQVPAVLRGGSPQRRLRAPGHKPAREAAVHGKPLRGRVRGGPRRNPGRFADPHLPSRRARRSDVPARPR